jgi:hypothetical protein
MATRRPAVVVPAISSSIALLTACGNSDKKSVSLDDALGSRAEVEEGLAAYTEHHAWRTATWLSSKYANSNYPGDLSSPEALALTQISECSSNCHDLNGYSNNLTPGYLGNAPSTLAAIKETKGIPNSLCRRLRFGCHRLPGQKCHRDRIHGADLEPAAVSEKNGALYSTSRRLS